MGMLPYREQLLHPNWQRKRLERLEASGWACECCEDTTSTLHVHHRRYVKGRQVWEYDDGDLQVLCAPCHERHHADSELLSRVLLGASVADADRSAESIATALLAGYLHADISASIDDKDVIDAVLARDPALFALGALASVMSWASEVEWLRLADALKLIDLPFVDAAEIDAWVSTLKGKG